MSFDKLDKKVQEAAGQYNAAYNEDAWNKMEALLSKHMPQMEEPPPVEKKTRYERWLVLLLGFVIVSLITLFLYSGNKQKSANRATMPIAGTSSKNESMVKGIENNSNSENQVPPTHSLASKPANQLFSQSPLHNALLSSRIIKNNSLGKTAMSSMQAAFDKVATSPINEKNSPAGEAAMKEDTYQAGEFTHQPVILINSYQQITVSNKPLILNPVKNSNGEKTMASETKKSMQAKQHAFRNSFSLHLSAGPDVSAVNINNVGSFNLLYGAGLGYKIGKRWQIRTGFYSVKKVYGAKPSDYHPPSFFWNLYPDLEDINADCRVNEVPLIVSYTFSQNAKKSWFGAAGISSYFMKRETYNYFSKPTPGGYQHASYTIRNKNTHYLSSLRLSAGYERKFNNTFSLSTEPYLNLPLSGIGFGKVKLNSAGALFTLSIKPFAKK